MRMFGGGAGALRGQVLQSRLRWLAGGVIALACCALLGLLGWWLIRVRPLESAIRRGAMLVGRATTPDEISRALDQWEAETGSAWHDSPNRLAARLIDQGAWDDPVRAQLLIRATSADFLRRADDWKRWLTNYKKRSSTPLRLDSGEFVSLSPRWKSPIGATAAFSTILPLDGSIFAAALGRGIGIADDEADGVVRVDGVTGESSVLFVPPDGRTRDVLGLAAASETLVVVTRAGFAYGVDFTGKQKWSAPLGAPAASLPLIIERGANVAVVTSGGRLIVLQVATGRTIWSTVVEPRRDVDSAAPIGFGLTAARSDRSRGAILVSSASSGTLFALRVEDGRLLWKQSGASSEGASASSVASGANQSLIAQLSADGRLRTLALRTAGPSVSDFFLGVSLDSLPLAPPRWLGARRDFAGGWLTCGAGPDGVGVISLSGAGGLAWRNCVPGALTAAPACADLNGDLLPEIIVTSTDHAPRLTVISSSGHWLRTEPLDAAVRAAPVVADVDGDGHLELLFADDAGWLHCRATGKAGPVLWGLSAGDPCNSFSAENAFSFSQAPFGYQSRWRPEN